MFIPIILSFLLFLIELKCFKWSIFLFLNILCGSFDDFAVEFQRFHGRSFVDCIFHLYIAANVTVVDDT